MICFCIYSPHCPWSSFSISGHMAPRVFQGGHRGKLHSTGGGGGVTAQEQVRRETARVEIKVRSPQLLGKCWETLGSSPPLSEEVLELPLGAKKKTTIQKTTSGNCHCRVLTQVLCPAPGATSFDGYKEWMWAKSFISQMWPSACFWSSEDYLLLQQGSAYPCTYFPPSFPITTGCSALERAISERSWRQSCVLSVPVSSELSHINSQWMEDLC